MGTPNFAVPSLRALIAAGYKISAVMTQPDRPSGRGQALKSSPIKLLAQEANIDVLQPQRMRRDPGVAAQLRELAPDAIVVVAFGQILPQEVLDIPPKGCLNLHGSLLPAYRGAGPIQWALIRGETTTGVTTMLMNAGTDTGPTFQSAEVEIDPEDDAGTLGERMAVLGAELLMETLTLWFANRISPTPQPAYGISLAPLLSRGESRLHFEIGALALHNRIRGLNPWPGAHTTLAGDVVKVLKSRPLFNNGFRDLAPGTVVDVSQEGWLVACTDGQLLLRVVQLPGRKPQPAAEAARGLRQLKPGVVLGMCP